MLLLHEYDWPKFYFLAFFWPDMKMEWDDYDSKYIVLIFLAS